MAVSDAVVSKESIVGDGKHALEKCEKPRSSTDWLLVLYPDLLKPISFAQAESNALPE